MFEFFGTISDLFIALNPSVLLGDLVMALGKFLLIIPDAMGVLLVLAILFFVIRLLPL